MNGFLVQGFTQKHITKYQMDKCDEKNTWQNIVCYLLISKQRMIQTTFNKTLHLHIHNKETKY
jgi:hypothetical protein